MRLLLLSFAISLVSVNVSAQYSENISSDRPGYSYSANTVGARVLQFQMGGRLGESAYTDGFRNGYIRGGFDGTIRVGVIERLEVGFSVLYSASKRKQVSPNSELYEFLNWSVNLKGNLLKSNGRTPNIGLFGEVIFPSKDAMRYTDLIYSQFKLLIEQPLEKRIRLTSNIGILQAQVAMFQYTLNLSVDVSPIATIYVEHFGQYAQLYEQYVAWNQEPEKEKYYYILTNGGFSVRPFPNFQIDMETGYGSWALAPSNTPNWYVALGLNWRVRFRKSLKKAAGG